jgi:ATP-dependent Clp protease protease subunit
VSRVVYVSDHISSESFASFVDEINKFVEESSKKTIKIILSCCGGDSVSALAYSAFMRRCPCPLEVRVYGEASSAAVLILASGTKGMRFMTRESRALVHEDTVKLKGFISLLEKQILEYREAEKCWCRLLEDLTGTGAYRWSVLHAKETILSASSCLALGLIDKII